MALQKRHNIHKISLIAAALGIALNMALWLGATALLTSSNRNIKNPPEISQDKQHKTHKLRPGKDNSQSASISWISYDAFKDLLAKNNKTNQAALQDKVEPVKKAAPRIKKLSQRKNNQQKTALKANQSKKETNRNKKKSSPKVALSNSNKKKPVNDKDKQLNENEKPSMLALLYSQQDGKNQTAKKSQINLKNNHSKQSKPTQEKKIKPEHKEIRAIQKNLKKWLNTHISQLLQTVSPNSLSGSLLENTSQKQTDKGKPTSAPKSDSESPPASFVKANHQIHLGEVVAGPGIEIKTVMPDFSAITRASSIPRPMKVKITFDKAGEATNAKIIRSSTYPNFDSAVLTSLYRWRATGKRMKKINSSFTMHFTLLW